MKGLLAKRSKVFPLVLAALLVSSLAQAGWTRNYEFVDLGGCNKDKYFHKLCFRANGTYANWDPASRAAVEKTLRQLPYDKLDKLAAQKKNLPSKIYFARLTDELAQAETSTADGVTFIALRPQFFLAESTVAGVPEKLLTLVHEFFHIYGGDLENTPMWFELANALEWRFTGGPNPVSRVNEIRVAIAKMNALYTLGDKASRQEAFAIDQAFSRPRGLPSVYSTVSLREYFAELGAYLTFDPSLVERLPPEVSRILIKNKLGFLVNAAKIPKAEKPQVRLHEENPPVAADFVGMLISEQRPWCTVTLIQPGVVVMPKDCVAPYVKRTSADPSDTTRYPFFALEFRRNKETVVYIDGFNLDFSMDVDDSGFAYATFDPKLTEGKIFPPKIRLATSADYADAGNAPSVLSLGFPLPLKPQRIVAQWSGPCVLQKGEKAKCPAWFGSSGSPLLSADPKNPGGILIWGLLSNTFQVGVKGLIIPNIRRDAWGDYSESEFIPMDLHRIPDPYVDSNRQNIQGVRQW